MAVRQDHIEETLYILEGRAIEFTREFFQELFRSNRGIEIFFIDTDFNELRPKFARALYIIASNRGNPVYLKNYLFFLGEKHVKYGISEAFFPLFEETLIRTLEKTCKDDWSPEKEDAWREFYIYMTDFMEKGMDHELMRVEFESFLDSKNKNIEKIAA